MTLTLRGAAVAVLAVLLGVGGALLGHPVLILLATAALAAVVAALAVTVGRAELEVTREVHPEWVEAGKEALAHLVVRNRSTRRLPAAVAHDRRTGGSEPVRLSGLRPGAVARHTYSLPTGARGRLAIGPVVVERADLFGLARNRVTVGAMSVLHVHPRLHPAASAAGATARHGHDGAVRTTSMRGGAELRSLRDYVPGDEPRHVHWKASARTGRLMVRDLVDPEETRFTVLLDDRSAVFTPERFDVAVEVAASLAHASALDGLRTRLCTTSGMDLDTAGGLAGSRRVLGVLSDIQVAQVDVIAVDGLADLAGSLVFVTAWQEEMAARVLARLVRQAASVTVVDVADDGRHVDLPGVVRIAARDAASVVAAWNSGVRG
ncbi:DUF58 domain-containing protein [Saccharothrix longispora]|uniref:DUF58 domain-containing protein n=1 Tax=Saccharothrix longispora TaxID=33920 RepID=UPI0028FD14A2|nr:DUF58 domain-containing protein [Saccharothrix longispora]MDU0292965.1 DUF58 domain-containing protein [Saccharothrix longispora]